MKQFYLFIALIALTLTASAAPRPTNYLQTASGNWSDQFAWSLGRAPQDGDSVIIPIGSTATIDKNTTLNNVYVNIMGTLSLKKTLTLDNQSTVTMQHGASIKAKNVSRTTEIIIIGGVKKYDENAAVTIVGYGTANKYTGVSPNGFSASSTLPVTYSSYDVYKNNNNVVISWSTSRELNNNNFEIQRSFDGSNWNVIGVVLGAGTATEAKSYSYTDRNVTAAVVYYRLRQVDLDGNFTYSDVKSIHSNATASTAKVYAAGKNVNVDFGSEVKNNITVRLFNTNGQMIAQQNYDHASKVVLNANNTNNGIYVVQVTDGTSTMSSTKILL